jgi:hypothetical protein
MTRLDAAIDAAREEPQDEERRVFGAGTRRVYWYAAAAAAVVALVAMSVLAGLGYRPSGRETPAVARDLVIPEPPVAAISADPALVSLSGQHFERSKLVLLGLATRDPRVTAGDWAYERELASTLLDDTRLYRMAAEERGMTSLAGVMRDLELVLLQTSMTEDANTESLEQLQRLIRRRDLLTKMNATYGGGS